MDIDAMRKSLKPVGDPNDWENNDDYMHPDNFKIRLFQTFDDTMHYLKTGEKRNFVSKEDMLKELFELAEKNKKEEE
jgi:hypothetical protein